MFRDVPVCSGMFRHVPECSVFRVLSTAVDILWAVKASPRDHTATKENCFDFNRVPLHQYGQYRMIWSQASIYEENHRNLQKGEERNNMHAGWNISAYLLYWSWHLAPFEHADVFFYRRPQGYALDPLKIRTLRCSIHTEPPLKDPCEHSENIEQSRMNKVSDGRFVRCCVSVAQESESLEHSILPT